MNAKYWGRDMTPLRCAITVPQHSAPLTQLC